MERIFVVIGSISAFIGVALGAFAAHGLKERLAADLLGAFEVGVRYHLIHALAMLAVAWAYSRWPGPAVAAAGWLFLAGIVLFSGSLYALALSGVRGLGMITPIGGLAFLGGWLCLAWGAWKS